MPSPKSDLPQGTLDMLILQIVSLGPIHGYGIAQRLQQMSKDVLQVQQGSLYPALHRLEGKGFLKSKWQPARAGLTRELKFYQLTAAGKRQLLAEESKWKQMTAAIARIMWPSSQES
jgi:transcriptional regulator